MQIGSKCNSNQKWNNDKCWCECKNSEKHNAYKKRFYLKSSYMYLPNSWYAASTIDDFVITWDEIIDAAVSISTNLNCCVPLYAVNIASTNFDDKNVRHKMNYCILHTVLLVVLLLFIIAIAAITQSMG